MIKNRNSEFDQLYAAYTQLINEFRSLKHPKLDELANSLEKSFTQIDEWLAQPTPPVTRSALVTGMEQGLRETPQILADFPAELRELALKAYWKIVEHYVPDFVEKDRELIEKVKERGKIRNEREWYLLRHRVDELEGREGHNSELDALYELLGEYETRA